MPKPIIASAISLCKISGRDRLPSELSVSEPNRNDWAFRVAEDLEAGLSHASSELDGVRAELVHVARILEEVEDFHGGTNDGWGDRVGEEVGTSTLADQLDDLLVAGGVSSGGSSESYGSG